MSYVKKTKEQKELDKEREKKFEEKGKDLWDAEVKKYGSEKAAKEHWKEVARKKAEKFKQDYFGPPKTTAEAKTKQQVTQDKIEKRTPKGKGETDKKATRYTSKKGKGKEKDKKRATPGGYSRGGRVGNSHGGSVSSRLTKAGPVAKPN